MGNGEVWQELSVVAEVLDELDDNLSSGDDSGEVFSSPGVQGAPSVVREGQLKALAYVLLYVGDCVTTVRLSAVLDL